MHWLDKAALAAANALLGQQPRADYTIIQLPNGGLPQGSDILPVWRNGGTVAVAVSGLPISQSGTYSVTAAGAIGDGVTVNNAAFTSAQASAGTSAMFVPPGAYRISGSMTLTAPLQFAVGAMLQMDSGTVVTLNGGIIANPSQIFSGAGTVVISGATPQIYAEWFGAKGDGVTDDSVALNAAIASVAFGAGYYQAPAGRVQLLAKTYFHTATILVLRGNITIVGMGVDTTFLMTPAASATTNMSVSPAINSIGVSLRDFSLICGPQTWATEFTSAVPSPSTARGLAIQNVIYVEVVNVNSYQHGTNFYFTNISEARFLGLKAQTLNSTAPNCYGFYLDGTSVCQSLRFTDCVGYMPLYAGAGYCYGVYSRGPNQNDQWFENCEMNSCSYGFYFDYTLATGFSNASDVRITNCTADSNFLGSYNFKNAPAGSAIVLSNSWAGGVAAGGQVSLNGCSNIVVSGMLLFASSLLNTGAQGINLTNCTNCSIVNNNIVNMPLGIYVVGLGRNTFANNLITMPQASTVAQKGLNAITLITTCLRNTIMGNVIDGLTAGSFGYGIYLGPGCDYNNVIGNSGNIAALTSGVIYNDSSNTHSYVAGVTT